MGFIKRWLYEVVRAIVIEILEELTISKEVETIKQNKEALQNNKQNEEYLKDLVGKI